jgi:DNA-binding response OmpR family regulator
MARNSVLLIDDDPELLRLLEAAFTKAGYMVASAADGRSGMKLFASQVPDAVVTDIIMPTQEGIETIVAMKGARPDVKILAMSGGGRIVGEQFLYIAGHLGADRVIAKPFRLAEVVQIVDELIEAPATA